MTWLKRIYLSCDLAARQLKHNTELLSARPQVAIIAVFESKLDGIISRQTVWETGCQCKLPLPIRAQRIRYKI